MALSARQINVSTAVPLLVAGSGSGTTFKNISGTVTDPLPISIKNEGTTTVYLGGPDVSGTTGQSLPGGASIVMNLYGNPADVVYAFAATATVVSVLVGRQ